MCRSLPFTLMYAWYVRQYPPEIGYECITRTLPAARRSLLYQLTILPFCVLVRAKNTADSCIFFSSLLRLNLRNCVRLNRKAGILYLRSSPNHMGVGISPMCPLVSPGVLFPASADVVSSRLINTVITLNNLILSIHLVTGYLSLCYNNLSYRHVPGVHFTTVSDAHVKQEITGSVLAHHFLLDLALYDVAVGVHYSDLCGLDVAVLVIPWSTRVCGSGEYDQSQCEECQGDKIINLSHGPSSVLFLPLRRSCQC